MDWFDKRLRREQVGTTLDDHAVARVRDLAERRSLTATEVEAISAHLRRHEVCPDPSPDCQRCGGSGRIALRPIQAEALREAYDHRGLFGHLGVGSGKTLVTLLAPTLLRAARPVLLIPAALREKTLRDYHRYRLDWYVTLPRIISYEELGLARNNTLLEEISPDLLLLDEADYVRNLDAGRTRRVRRAVEALGCHVIAVSGTLRTNKLLDSWHYLAWALGEHAPVPMSRSEAERWSLTVDDGGDLAGLPDYATHLRTRRGVVFSHAQDCDASITIAPWEIALPQALRQTIEEVERSSLRPDGELLDDFELPEYLCMLAQGFYHVWDPMPPQWWLAPRRAWWTYQRAVLEEHLEGFDTSAEIIHALDNAIAEQPPAAAEGRALLAEWRAVKDGFEPNPVAVWLDRAPVEVFAERARKPGTLLWVKHRAIGRELERLGLPYYGGGTEPETAPRGKPISLSIKAHHRGANLQHGWYRSIVLHPPAKARIWEQLIGRTHRAQQKADHIFVDPYAPLEYHRNVLQRVKSEASAVGRASGFQQKITIADWTQI